MTLAIITIFTLAIYALAASILCAYFFANSQLLSKFLLSEKLDKKRIANDLKIWQDKVSVISGRGPVYGKTEPPPPQEPAKRVVAPSTVVNELRNQERVLPVALRTDKVPDKIKKNFLAAIKN